jgi:hypothetical protein
VKAQVPITLPRPRDPLSVEFLEFQKQLLRQLGHETKMTGSETTDASRQSMREGQR